MSYGITTDIIGFADTALGISLQGVKNPVRSPSEAKAMDSNGDVVAETVYDTGYGQGITLDYVCAKASEIKFYDTLTVKDFRGGKVVGGYVINGITVTTSNSDFAKVSISAAKTIATDTDVAKYDWGTGANFTGGKGAKKFGFATDTATRLTGSTLTAKVSSARAQDSTGEELCVDVGEGRIDASHTLVGVTGVPGGAADTGWTLLGGPSNDESNTDYESGSAVVFQNISAS